MQLFVEIFEYFCYVNQEETSFIDSFAYFDKIGCDGQFLTCPYHSGSIKICLKWGKCWLSYLLTHWWVGDPGVASCTHCGMWWWEDRVTGDRSHVYISNVVSPSFPPCHPPYLYPHSTSPSSSSYDPLLLLLPVLHWFVKLSKICRIRWKSM